MDDAFIIMQIGNQQMDAVCDDVIVPAIEAAGLKARRVDRDSTGELLKVEIIDFISRSPIIIADLTNERPNCYLEIGYAMGLGKKASLILTVREDHHHRSQNYSLAGPRVHFDLEGYDLLLWNPQDLDRFRRELEQRIKRRLAVVQSTISVTPTGAPQPSTPIFDDSWISTQHAAAINGIAKIGREGFMEAAVALQPKGSWRQPLLLSTIEQSQIPTFGWPIGIVLQRDGYRPQATSEGVRAEVGFSAAEAISGNASYDYWYIRQTGDFYLLQSLFEDELAPESIFLDTRIVRVTELLLFLSRCYTRLELPDSSGVSIRLTHGGLKDRTLRAASPTRHILAGRTIQEATVTTTVVCAISELQSKLTEQVRALLEPLFILFNFFELSDKVWAELIDNFVAGRIS